MHRWHWVCILFNQSSYDFCSHFSPYFRIFLNFPPYYLLGNVFIKLFSFYSSHLPCDEIFFLVPVNVHLYCIQTYGTNFQENNITWISNNEMAWMDALYLIVYMSLLDIYIHSTWNSREQVIKNPCTIYDYKTKTKTNANEKEMLWTIVPRKLQWRH